MQVLRRICLITVLCAVCLTGVNVLVYAQEAAPPILNVVELTDHLSLIWDMGSGNTLVLSGEDGVLVTDTKVKELAEPLVAKVADISGGKPIRFVILTHWHYDHVGGNDMMAEAGATIIAHENVRASMSAEQRLDMFDTTVPPSPKIALPLLTFTTNVTFHLNDEEVQVFHLGPGHTDGDAIVYFRHANVIQLGDLYFNGFYPYIGIEAGGSINSMVTIGQTVLEMIDDTTVIVPGHGAPAQQAEYAEYSDPI